MSLELDGFELLLYRFELFDLKQFTSELGSGLDVLEALWFAPVFLL